MGLGISGEGSPGRCLPGVGAHPAAVRDRDEWLTPPEILDALGRFDLDPCAPICRPWPTANRHLTVEDDGLSAPWAPFERVWCNPPYSRASPWIQKMATHGRGIALLFARAETKRWHTWVWPYASHLLFLEGRVTFCMPDGRPSRRGHSSGGPSVLVAYGADDADALGRCGLIGAHARVVRGPR